MLTNKVTLDTLASYADPAKEARDRYLPEGPFTALVKRVKDMRAPKGAQPHFSTVPLCQQCLLVSNTLPSQL